MKNKSNKSFDIENSEELDKSPKLSSKDFNSSTRNNKNKFFKKKLEDGSPIWNLDNCRLKKLNQLASMELPERTAKVLSKLTINHQLRELGDLIETTENTLTYHAIVNKACKNFESVNNDGEVFIRIFTLKDHTKPDVKAAENFTVTSYPGHNKECTCQISRFHSCLNSYHSYVTEDLKILQLENVVIIKKLGTVKNPIKTLCEMVKSNRSSLKDLLDDILCSYKIRLLRTWKFGQVEMDVEKIFYFNDTWIFVSESKTGEIDNVERLSKSEESAIITSNIINIVKIFHRFKMTKQEIRDCVLGHCSADKHRNYFLWKRDDIEQHLEEFLEKR